MNRRPTPTQIISHALSWLDAGLLPSALPNKLFEEFPFLSPAQARELANRAIERHKKEGKQAKPGE